MTNRKLYKTSLLRALAPTTPTIVFPAMNTLMYEHPLTAVHLKTIQEVIGYEVIGPIGKGLACGDIGTLIHSRRILLLTVYLFRSRSNGRMERYCETRWGSMGSYKKRHWTNSITTCCYLIF